MTDEPATKKAKRETCGVRFCQDDATTQCVKCEKALCVDCATLCAGGYDEGLYGNAIVTSCAVAWCPAHAPRDAHRCYRKVRPDRSPPDSPLRFSEFHEASAVFCSQHSTKCYLCGIAVCEYHEKRDETEEDIVEARMYDCDRCYKTVCAHCSTQCGCDRNECQKCVNPKYTMTKQDYMCKWCRDDNRRGAWIEGDTSDEENGRLDANGKLIKKPSDDDDDDDD